MAFALTNANGARGPAIPEDTRAPTPGRVRLRTLVLLRWLAVGGQTAAVLTVHFGFGFPLPILGCLVAIAASAWLNVVLTLRFPSSKRLSDRVASLYLGYDLLQLAILLFLTGGLENPFAILFLVPVTISATILSLGSTIRLGLVTFICVSVLAVWHFPLPWSDPSGLALPKIYVAGTWLAIILGIAFLSGYAWRVAAESRRMSDALAETQMALARQQQLAALGGLAAAAAHELGTPLSTIALVARELEQEVAADDPLAEDVALLKSQAERCREILDRLSRRPGEEQAARFLSEVPVTAVIEEATEPHRRESIKVRTIVVPAVAAEDDSDGARVLQIRRSAEIVHALGNLIENAIDFARHEVTIVVDWDDAELRVEVHDDGPGFPTQVMGRVGEPYITTRDRRAVVRDAAGGQPASDVRGRGGLGLGIFIAKTLLERTGAEVTFANGPKGGAVVAIRWPRTIIEVVSSGP